MKIQSNMISFNMQEKLVDEKSMKQANEMIPNLEDKAVAVTVSISDEARKQLQNNSNNFDDVVKQRELLLSGKIAPETDYSAWLGNKIAESQQAGTSFSLQDTAQNALDAYADIYDEIVQGYKDGTREVYTEDSSAEDGYRKLTMDEELEKLDAAFAKRADLIEALANQKQESDKAFEEYYGKLQKIGANRATMANSYHDTLVKEKAEGIVMPSNVSEKIIKATNVFAQQYAMNGGKGIADILSGIKIW